ncbi:MAG: DNA repair protein RecN [Verrucomicrobiota bacterium]
MLRCLRIKNLAVIDDLTWELESGFNILTGETGAGKSILIDAFNLLLGERADKTLIRDGADQCVVEAELRAPRRVKKLLEEHGIESDIDPLILKRIFTSQGQNRQFINGSPTTLQALKKLGDFLVDIHGPHDHQSLLSSEAQRAALDAFGKIDLEKYQQLYREQTFDRAQLEEFKSTESGDWATRLDFLQFQIQEIEQAHLRPEEEEQLEREYQIAAHGQRIVELGENVRQILGEGEQDVFGKLAFIERLLQEWERLDASATHLRELNQGAIAQLQELSGEVENKIEETQLDVQRFQEIEARVNLLQTLRRKYGATIPDILNKLEELKTEHAQLAGREENIARLEKQIAERQKQLDQIAEKLSLQRKNAAPKLSKNITEQLRELGFKKSDFPIQLRVLPHLAPSGKDTVEFLFAPNPGEGARPLRDIASSGEMARVMLAVKTVLAQQDDIPILIFDEVDANVGGETAVTVGKKLRELANSHQVLCITHLPQVASSGHVHFRVEKNIQSGRTIAQIQRLNKEDRIDELSRMLGGQSKSAHALAKSMLSEII